jgi:hypothetical protein
MEKESIEVTNSISGVKNNTSETLNNSGNVVDNIITTTKFDFFKKKLFIILLLLILVLITGILAFFLLTKQTTDKTNILNVPTSTPKQYSSTPPAGETGMETKVREKDVLLKLGVGYQLAIEKSWDIKIIESGKQHNFLTAGVSNSGVRIEIEAFSHTLPNWEKYLKNELYQIEKTEAKKINNNSVKVETGKEAFAQSNARLIIGTWDNQDKTLVVRVIGNNQNSVNSLFEQLSSSVNLAQRTTFKLIKEVKAAESTIPSKLPNMEYKEIEVMGKPLEDMITSKDASYKDGYAKGYRFVAFKSQRLTAIALEKDYPSSYIASQVFDSDGNEVDIERGTRIEFKVPHTGFYYYVVRTRGNKEGKVLVGVDDRDQSRSRIYIKYPDGAEFLADPDEPLSFLVGSYNIGLIIEIPRPITVLENNTIEYEYIVPEFGPRVGLFKSILEGYTTPDIYKVKGLTATSTINNIEDDKYKTKIEILQLGANRILITPKDGLFQNGSHVVVIEKTISTPDPKITQGYGGASVFTQDRKPVTMPILKQLHQDFPDKFWKMIESYFNWSTSQDSPSVEIEGGWLEAKLWDDNTPRFFRDYFISKGYVVNELNSNERTISLTKDRTVCKIYKGSCDNNICGDGIYCGTLP